MDRRKAVLTLVGGCSCGLAYPQAFPRIVSPMQVVAVARGCGDEPGNSLRPTRLATCGVSELDANIELELEFLRRVFNVSPTFYFGNDDPARPVAGTYRNPGGNGEATVVLGVNFIQREIRLNPGLWQSAVIGVIAHEWAHALQYGSHLQDRQFMWETHADFMSGWYLGVKRTVGNRLIRPGPLAASLFEKGVQSDFFNADTHGTADVRVGAMLKGYDLGLNGHDGIGVDVYDAANLGYLHAQRVAAR
jgi:hypothetical protein